MKILSLGLVVLAACGGSDAPEDIVAICTALTECGSIPGSETDHCIAELDAATPDSATRAANECATCVETMSCGDVTTGKCGPTCAPFVQTISSSPGTVMVTGTGSQPCTSSTPANHAFPKTDGTVVVELTCGGTALRPLNLGAMKRGTPLACTAISVTSPDCTVTGSISLIEKSGTSWINGECTSTCTGPSTATLKFDVPFRYVF